jgi:hypothetical protein
VAGAQRAHRRRRVRLPWRARVPGRAPRQEPRAQAQRVALFRRRRERRPVRVAAGEAALRVQLSSPAWWRLAVAVVAAARVAAAMRRSMR